MQKGQALILVLAAILIITTVAGGAYFVGKLTNKPLQSQNPVITFQTPQPIPSPSVTPDETVYTESDRSANWKTYEDLDLGFSLKYPSDFFVNDKAAKNTITIEKEYQSQKEAPGYPSFMYISVIPDDFKGKAGEIYVYDPEETKILLNIQIGETDQDRRYTRLADITIDGVSAKVFENLVPPSGGDKRRLYFHKRSNTYMIGLITSSADNSMTLETFKQILATFKFL